MLTCNSKEEPVAKMWQLMGANEHISEQTRQIISRLSWDVVEVDAMPDGMHDSEEQCSEGNDLVEGDSSIKGDILVQWCLPKVGDEITSHCQ